MAADMGKTLRKKRKQIEDCDDAKFIGAVKALKKEDISTDEMKFYSKQRDHDAAELFKPRLSKLLQSEVANIEQQLRPVTSDPLPAQAPSYKSIASQWRKSAGAHLQVSLLFESCDFADNFKAFWEEKGASIMQVCSSLKLEVCTTELTTKGYEAGRKLIMKIWNVAFQTTSTQGSRRSNQPAIFINKAGTAYDSTRPDIATCHQPAGVT